MQDHLFEKDQSYSGAVEIIICGAARVTTTTDAFLCTDLLMFHIDTGCGLGLEHPVSIKIKTNSISQNLIIEGGPVAVSLTAVITLP